MSRIISVFFFHFFFVFLWMSSKGSEASSGPTPSLRVILRAFYYTESGLLSSECGKLLYDQDFKPKFKTESEKIAKLEKICTDAGHKVALSWDEDTGNANRYFWLMAVRYIRITGEEKDAMSKCGEKVMAEFADRVKVVTLFPSLEKLTATGCPEITLNNVGFRALGKLFTCDRKGNYYYNMKDFSCVLRDKEVKYPNTVPKTVRISGVIDAMDAPSGSCLTTNGYTLFMNYFAILDELSKVCSGYEHLEWMNTKYNLGGELTNAWIDLEMLFMPSSWSTTNQDMLTCITSVTDVLKELDQLKTKFPTFMAGSYSTHGCPVFRINQDIGFEVREYTGTIRSRCATLVNQRLAVTATYDAETQTCALPPIPLCTEANKCLEDFSKNLMTVLTTTDPDTTSLCSSISTVRDCAKKATGDCELKYKKGIEMYAKKADMMCVVKEGWIDDDDADTDTCIKADIVKAIEEVRKTAVTLLYQPDTEPAGCSRLSTAMDKFSKTLVKCTAKIIDQALTINRVNLDAIGVACPSIGRVLIIGLCGPHAAVTCITDFQGVASCNGRGSAYFCTDSKLLGCPETYRMEYRSLVDQIAKKSEECSALTEKCDVTKIKSSISDVIKAVSAVDGSADPTAACGDVRSKGSATIGLIASCSDEIKTGVKASLDGHAASALYKCSNKMPSDCQNDAGFKCTRELVKNMALAFLNRESATDFCGGVTSASAGFCTSKSGTQCKSQAIYNTLSTAESKIIEGAKKACAASATSINNPFCTGDLAKEWLDKFADKSLFEGVSANAELTQTCSGLHEALEFAYQDMTICTDEHLQGGKDAMEVYQSLLKTTCPGWKWPKYPSAIKARIDRTAINVTEGAEDAPVPINFVTNPAVVCGNMQNCKIEINVAVQNDRSPKFITTTKPVTQAVVGKYDAAKDGDYCRFELTKELQKEEVTVPLVATIEAKKDGAQTRDFILKYKQTVDGQVVASRDIQRIVSYIKDKDTLSMCQVVGDPHIITFDHLYYHNYLSGIFTLFKHEVDPMEVQVITYKCYEHGTCVCAVAIKSGDDVIVVDRCKGPKKDDVMRFSTSSSKPDSTIFQGDVPLKTWVLVKGTLSKGTRIYEQNMGRTIEVKLPKGTIIRINVRDDYLSVMIRPAPTDYFQTSGLCGTYSKKHEDDLTKPDTTTAEMPENLMPNEFINAWRVDPKDTIFKGVAADDMIVDMEDTYCVCDEDKESVCKPNGNMMMTDLHWSSAMTDVTQNWMSMTTAAIAKYGKVYGVMDFIDKVIDSSFTPSVMSWSQASGGWTEQKALEYCNKFIKDKPAVKSCMKAPTISVEASVTMCMEDVKLSGGTTFAVDALGSYLYDCINTVSMNVTLGESALGETIIQGISTSTCPLDCNGQGSCVNAKCTCNENWVNNDCTASLVHPPFMFRLLQRGLCDLNKYPCKSWVAYAGGLIENDDLTIVLEKVKFTSLGVQRSNKLETVAAKQLSFSAVKFTLPEPGNSYIVGISNDKGKTYGMLLPFMAYNSTYQECLPSKGTCTGNDGCLGTENGKCFLDYSESTLASVVHNLTQFKEVCGKLADTKACLAKQTNECTKTEIEMMTSYLTGLENNVLLACQDQYYGIMAIEQSDPDTCKPKEATDLLNNFMKTEYQANISPPITGTPAGLTCKTLGETLSQMTNLAQTCSEITRARVAQAMSYPKGLLKDNCTDVTWPPWKSITELDLCKTSPNYQLLDKYVQDVTKMMPVPTSDWTQICSQYSSDMDKIEAKTALCKDAQQEMMKKMAAATKKAIESRCPAKTLTPSDPTTCKPTEAVKGISDVAKEITGKLVQGSNTDQMCSNYMDGIRNAKQLMNTCTEETRKSLDETVNYLNDILVPDHCKNYSEVPWPKNPEGCLGTANGKCFLDYSESTLSSVAHNLTQFKEMCGKLADTKTCLAKQTTDCTESELAMITSYLNGLEKDVLSACNDQYFNLMEKEQSDPDTCKPKEAIGILNNFMKTEYRAKLSPKNDTGQTCKKLGETLSQMNNLVQTCSEITRARVAQAMSYPKGLLKDNCTDVTWPPWKRITELDLCKTSPNYQLLDKYVQDVTKMMPVPTSDWSQICSNYASDMEKISPSTALCKGAQLELMKKMAADTKKAIETRCPAETVTPSDPPTCKPTEAVKGLSDVAEVITGNLVQGSNTDEMCSKYMDGIRNAKQLMNTCTDGTKKSLDDTVNYLNDILVPDHCKNYSEVPWPKNPDGCLGTDNGKCFQDYSESTLSSVAHNLTQFKEMCGKLAETKTCLAKQPTDCTEKELEVMTSYLNGLEKDVLSGCNDKYFNLMEKEQSDPDSCKPKEAIDLLNNFMKTEYQAKLSPPKNETQTGLTCKKLDETLSQMNNLVQTCSEITRARVAQAMSYPKGLLKDNCTDVTWPPWKRITELDLCTTSPNYQLLDKYVQDVTKMMPVPTSDWTQICSKYAADMEKIAAKTGLCKDTQLEMMKKMEADTKKAIETRCPAKTLTPSDPPTCKPTEAVKGLSDVAKDVTGNLVQGSNTDQMCLKYMDGIRNAKQLMNTCTEGTKKSLDETVNYLNDILVPDHCKNYSPVPWPKKPNDSIVTVDPAPYPGLTIGEGGGGGNISVTLKKNPSDVCKGQKDCNIEINVGVPKADANGTRIDDEIPQINLEWPPGTPKKDIGCTIPVNSNKPQTIRVTGTADMLYDGPKKRHVVLTYTRKVNGTVVSSEEVGRIQVVAKNQDKKSVCQFIGDLHVTTFDGLFYNNFHPGFFIAYQRKTLPYQVQLAVTRCKPSTTCICGVAIQSGDDVFVIDRCPKPANWYGGTCSPPPCPKPTETALSTKLYKNGDLTPSTKIMNRDGGQGYKVLLPTGTLVNVVVTGSALNVIINPSPKDIGQTRGLCGFFNSNPADDFLKKDGGTYSYVGKWHPNNRPDDFIKSWLLPSDKQTIFYGVPPKPFKLSTYCSCVMEGNQTVPNCHPGAVDPSIINWGTGYKDVTGVVTNSSYKPNLEVITTGTGNDIKMVRPTSPSISIDLNPPPLDLTLPKGNWTNVEAITEFCKKLMNSNDNNNKAMLDECKKVPGSEPENILNSCIYSIKRTGKTTYAKDPIESAKENCRSNNVRESPKEGAPWLKLPPLPKTCPGDCNGKGECVDGKCKCKEGYENSDCSVKTDSPPTFVGTRNNGTCDTRKQNCSFVPIIGENLRKNSTCVFEEIKVHKDKPFERTGNVMLMPTAYDNKNQIRCKTPDPPTPGIFHPPNKDITQKYPTAPPFNLPPFPLPGTTPKPGYLDPGPVYLPYNSLCLDCDPKTVTCKPKNTGCAVGNKCYAPGEGIPSKCLLCDPAKANDRLSSSNAPGCTAAVNHGRSKEKKDVGLPWWVILLLLLLLLLLALLLLCCICYLCKKKKDAAAKDAAAKAAGIAALSQAAIKPTLFGGITPAFTSDLKSNMYGGGGGGGGGGGAADMKAADMNGDAVPIITPVVETPVKAPGGKHGLFNAAYSHDEAAPALGGGGISAAAAGGGAAVVASKSRNERSSILVNVGDAGFGGWQALGAGGAGSTIVKENSSTYMSAGGAGGSGFGGGVSKENSGTYMSAGGAGGSGFGGGVSKESSSTYMSSGYAGGSGFGGGFSKENSSTFMSAGGAGGSGFGGDVSKESSSSYMADAGGGGAMAAGYGGTVMKESSSSYMSGRGGGSAVASAYGGGKIVEERSNSYMSSTRATGGAGGLAYTPVIQKRANSFRVRDGASAVDRHNYYTSSSTGGASTGGMVRKSYYHTSGAEGALMNHNYAPAGGSAVEALMAQKLSPHYSAFGGEGSYGSSNTYKYMGVGGTDKTVSNLDDYEYMSSSKGAASKVNVPSLDYTEYLTVSKGASEAGLSTDNNVGTQRSSFKYISTDRSQDLLTDENYELDEYSSSAESGGVTSRQYGISHILAAKNGNIEESVSSKNQASSILVSSEGSKTETRQKTTEYMTNINKEYLKESRNLETIEQTDSREMSRSGVPSIAAESSTTHNKSFDNSSLDTSSTFASKSFYTIGTGESAYDTATHVTSMYEANTAQGETGQKAVLQDRKVFLGALVSGKLLNRSKQVDEVPLYNYSRPENMHINPVFVDDGQAEYISSQAPGQYEFLRSDYNANVPMYSAVPMQTAAVQVQPMPIQTVVLDARTRVLPPQSPVMVRTAEGQFVQTQAAYVYQNQPEPLLVGSPPMQRRVVELNSYGNRSSTFPRGAAARQEAQSYAHSVENDLDEDDFYFVDSEALEKLNIPEDSVEEYVYAKRSELVKTQSET